VKKLAWSALSDRGKIRANNEDSFIGMCFDAREVHLLGKHGEAPLEQMDMVFAVSDGIGGASAGEFASKITVERITKLLPKAFKQTAAGIDVGASDVLSELYTQIHKALAFVGASYEECRGMGATLSLCWFTPEWMFFGHIGDSRIYYLPVAGGMRQMSHDDTYVGWLFRNGKINERESRVHPRRNIIQRALGAGHQFVEPQVGAIGLESGDSILICSDGVIDGLFDSQIEDILSTPQCAENTETSAQRLVRVAVEQSGRDNTTAVVIRVS